MKNIHDTYKLHNDVGLPCIGFGTWRVEDGEECYQSVLTALKEGYRHIDTATAYGNEASVGKAIKDSGIPRHEIFLTTKLWNHDHGYQNTLKAIDSSLKALGTDYVDLYLVHWPNPKEYREDYAQMSIDTWKAMEQIYKDGKAKAIGISNYMPHHIEHLLQNSEISPMVNQIRIFPGFPNTETVECCKKHNILIEAYSPLGSGKLFEAPELLRLAKKYNKSVAQICVRYSLQMGYLPLPKSVTPSRIKENCDVFDFEISENDMLYISTMKNYCGEGNNPDFCDF